MKRSGPKVALTWRGLWLIGAMNLLCVVRGIALQTARWLLGVLLNVGMYRKAITIEEDRTC